MKIALKNSSLLISKALEFYLQEYLCDEEEADLVIVDERVESKTPIFLISRDSDANLKIPFTKKMLFDELHRFYIDEINKQTKDHHLDGIIKDIKRKNRLKIDKIVKSYDGKG